jgi:hypothetical protein
MVAWTGRRGGWLKAAEADDPDALATTVDLDAVAAGLAEAYGPAGLGSQSRRREGD